MTPAQQMMYFDDDVETTSGGHRIKRFASPEEYEQYERQRAQERSRG